jgi:hypothetical protein
MLGEVIILFAKAVNMESRIAVAHSKKGALSLPQRERRGTPIKVSSQQIEEWESWRQKRTFQQAFKKLEAQK